MVTTRTSWTLCLALGLLLLAGCGGIEPSAEPGLGGRVATGGNNVLSWLYGAWLSPAGWKGGWIRVEGTPEPRLGLMNIAGHTIAYYRLAPKAGNDSCFEAEMVGGPGPSSLTVCVKFNSDHSTVTFSITNTDTACKWDRPEDAQKLIDAINTNTWSLYNGWDGSLRDTRWGLQLKDLGMLGATYRHISFYVNNVDIEDLYNDFIHAPKVMSSIERGYSQYGRYGSWVRNADRLTLEGDVTVFSDGASDVIPYTITQWLNRPEGSLGYSATLTFGTLSLNKELAPYLRSKSFYKTVPR